MRTKYLHTPCNCLQVRCMMIYKKGDDGLHPNLYPDMYPDPHPDLHPGLYPNLHPDLIAASETVP